MGDTSEECMDKARTYKVDIEGTNPLLLHNDNLEWAGELLRWQQSPENKKLSVAGDDRSPAWRWIGNIYHDGKVVGMPSDNLMTALREGAAKVPTGKRGGTFKRASQSGLVINEMQWPIVTPRGVVPYSEIHALLQEEDFAVHEQRAQALGFGLFVKRARVGQSKHVRVRPRFDKWTLRGTVTVFDGQITGEVLALILNAAGQYCGLGDWRPSSPKSPGPFGTFQAEVEEV